MWNTVKSAGAAHVVVAGGGTWLLQNNRQVVVRENQGWYAAVMEAKRSYCAEILFVGSQTI